MTYCLGIKLDSGLVLCSDSRTNAGVDRVSTFSKMHRFEVADDRQLVLMSAGNLATTQAVVDYIYRDISEAAELTVANAPYMLDIVEYIGQLSVQVQQKYAPDGDSPGFNATASFILGGQIGTSDPELYMIYPEGNHLRPSESHPYFQIGETKYGKPILDRIVEANTSPEIAMRCALVSMDSTTRSNASVGPPIELLYMARDQLQQPAAYHRLEQGDDYLEELRQSWNEQILLAFNNLPTLNIPS